MDLDEGNALALSEKAIAAVSEYPGGFKGRGIVICAGGRDLFTSAWVLIKVLRGVGCRLHIQMWHLGEREMDDAMRALVQPLNVECVDAYEVRKQFPARILHGWELKPFAMLHCPFKDVMLLDADNIPARDPTFLFDSKEYIDTGALFWPDYERLDAKRSIWKICGVPYRDEPEFETGQILIDKHRGWRALNLTMWYNEHSDFFYKHVYGDKETFHMAWRKLGLPYAVPHKNIASVNGLICQHDFEGNVLFQHQRKWTLDMNSDDQAFLHKDECLSHLRELRSRWSGFIDANSSSNTYMISSESRPIEQELSSATYVYRRVGYDARTMSFLPDHTIYVGRDRLEQRWLLTQASGTWRLRISGDGEQTCELERVRPGFWRGVWFNYEKMPIELFFLNNPGAGSITFLPEPDAHVGDLICFISAARAFAKVTEKRVFVNTARDIIDSYNDSRIAFGQEGVAITPSWRSIVWNQNSGNFLGAFTGSLFASNQTSAPFELPNLEDEPSRCLIQPWALSAENPPDEFLQSLIDTFNAMTGEQLYCIGAADTSRRLHGLDYSLLETNRVAFLRHIKNAKCLLAPRSGSAHIAAAYGIRTYVWMPKSDANWHLDYPNWNATKVLFSDGSAYAAHQLSEFLKTAGIFAKSSVRSVTMTVDLPKREPKNLSSAAANRNESKFSAPMVAWYSLDDPLNIGDQLCCPLDYFKFPGTRLSFEDHFPASNADIVVIGGGGLFHPHLLRKMEDIMQQTEALNPNTQFIAWGVGANEHGRQDFAYPTLLRKFALAGIRDYGQTYEYVPCVSCMHEAFSAKRPDAKHEIVVYEHFRRPLSGFGDVPRRNNRGHRAQMEEVLAFLASGEVVITNSYHGVYWSLLLGRKVMIYEPFSNRFMGFARHVPIINSQNWQRSLSNCVAYPEYLEECRSINKTFAESVRRFMLFANEGNCRE